MVCGGMLFCSVVAQGQVVRLDSCEQWALRQYPLYQKFGLIAEKEKVLLDQAKHLQQLQVQLAGQATYQSEVTELPIALPGISVPALSRDQYRLYTEFVQPLTAFRTVSLQGEWVQNQVTTERKQLELSQEQWLEQVRQTYFGLLMLEVQLKQLQLLQQDVLAAIEQMAVKSQVGTTIPRQHALYALEKLKVEQRLVEAKNQMEAGWEVMAMLTGKAFSNSNALELPVIALNGNANKRIEWELFELQRRGLQTRVQLLEQQRRPRMQLFLQTGVGRPALNMLSNDIRGYYLGGLRLQWNLDQLYHHQTDRKQLMLAQREVELQASLFERQNTIAITQQQAKIVRLQAALENDEKMLALQIQIRDSYAVNLEQGTVTQLEYLQQMHAVDQARQLLAMRRIQLLQAQFELKNLYGQL